MRLQAGQSIDPCSIYITHYNIADTVFHSKTPLKLSFFNPFLQMVAGKSIHRVSHAALLSSFQISLKTSSS